MSTSIQYLDKAMLKLRDLGLVPEKTEEAPIVVLLNRVSDLDQDKVVAIARTLSQTSLFNQVVREQVSGMGLSDRYTKVTDAFNTIRDDAKTMVEQLEDGKINSWERLQNVWMKATRGDIPARFDKIKKVYLDVAKDTNDQIEREHTILDGLSGLPRRAEGSRGPRAPGAQDGRPEAPGAEGGAREGACEAVEQAPADDLVARAKLELARDEKLRAVQFAEDRYQICKDLSDNLTVGYNTSEVVMAPARADHEREGARLQAGGVVLRHQRDGADRAQRLVHGPAGPEREHADAGRDEGRREQEPRGLSPRSAARSRRPRSRPATARPSAPTR